MQEPDIVGFIVTVGFYYSVKMAQLFWAFSMGIQTHTTNSRCNFFPPSPGHTSNLACWHYFELVRPCPSWTTGLYQKPVGWGVTGVAKIAQHGWDPGFHSITKKKSPNTRFLHLVEMEKGFSVSSRAPQYNYILAPWGDQVMGLSTRFLGQTCPKNEPPSMYLKSRKGKEARTPLANSLKYSSH